MDTVTTTAFVGIGSNLGDREAHLARAIELLSAEDGIEVTAVSQIRETEPVGPVEQGPFLNGAVHAASGNPLLAAAAFGCSLWWGFLYAATGRIGVAAAAHLVWDLLVMFGPKLA